MAVPVPLNCACTHAAQDKVFHTRVCYEPHRRVMFRNYEPSHGWRPIVVTNWHLITVQRYLVLVTTCTLRHTLCANTSHRLTNVDELLNNFLAATNGFLRNVRTNSENGYSALVSQPRTAKRTFPTYKRNHARRSLHRISRQPDRVPRSQRGNPLTQMSNDSEHLVRRQQAPPSSRLKILTA